MQGFDYEMVIKVAADNIQKLRKMDVFRLLNTMRSPETLQGMADYITRNRPEFKAEVEECLADLKEGV